MTGLTTLILASFMAVEPGDGRPEPVASLKPAPSLAAEYETVKTTSGHDAESQIRLALWCEAHGLEQQRLKHLAAVVLRDPSNALARGLMGLVEYQGKWKRPEAVADAMKADVARADLLAEYNGKRVNTPVAALPQYKLAVWCDEKGLKDEARAHLATVVRLDPTHADAWKRLGYKKVGNHWVTEGQAALEKAEHETQVAADGKWKSRLESLRVQLHDKVKREDSEKALALISDPRAVPTIMKVFAATNVANQRMAVQLLGQIDAVESSRSLAKLALLSESPEVRAKAIETLRRRDPREWADLPISLLRTKIVYTSKPVGGPNDPGVLDIKTKTANYKRIYRPGAAYQPQPGDRIVYDANGQPIVSRICDVLMSGEFSMSAFRSSMSGMSSGMYPQLGGYSYPQMGYPYYGVANAMVHQAPMVGPNAAAFSVQANKVLQQSPLAGQGQNLGAAMIAAERNNMIMAAEYTAFANQQAILQQQQSFRDWIASAPVYHGLNPSKPGAYLDMSVYRTINVPLAQLQRDAQNSQTAAVEQLNGDKAILDQINTQIADANTRSLALLTDTTSQSFGDDRQAWDKWLSNQVGYALMTPADVPTVVENVSINYAPSAVASPGVETSRYVRVSCFGKGTPVQTATGPRPIEDLKVGDLVLSQEMTSGRLRYRPITVVHHNPPSPTYNVALNGDPVISSYFHRFWKVGQGWVMARDLKTGDTIRVLGGVANVTAIESAPVQPVFNLDVADDGDFFAGNIAALVHDNSLPDLKQKAFDAPADALATAKK